MTARHTWFPYLAAAGGAILILKGCLVIASGDGANSTAVGVLYLTGLLIGLVVAVGAGLRRTSGWSKVAVAAGGVVLLVLWIMTLSDAAAGLIAKVSDSAVLQDEVPIIVAGMVLVGIATVAFIRDSQITAAPLPAASEQVAS